MLHPETIKKDFPIFEHNPALVYLDSAATAQKPKSVLEAMRTYYEEFNANVSRGLYPLAEMATTAVIQARERIANFIESEINTVIFVASATQGINLVATGLREQVTAKDNIVVTNFEHHSNFLPWKELAAKTGAEFRIAESLTNGILTEKEILKQIDTHTKILAFTAVSNVVGLVVPVQKIVAAVRAQYPNLLILIDACQAVGHIPVSVKEWDVDYLVFSGHKVFGPTGIGVLAGKKKGLEILGTVNVGGGTVLDPLASPVTYKKLPDSLEGGTPNIAGIIGLGKAIHYIESLGIEQIHTHEQQLLAFTEQRLKEVLNTKITIIGEGTRMERAGILSFVIEGLHPHDLAQLLGEQEICIRAGEHCARPLHRSLNLNASARISVSLYNTEADIEKCIHVIQEAVGLMKK